MFIFTIFLRSVIIAKCFSILMQGFLSKYHNYLPADKLAVFIFFILLKERDTAGSRLRSRGPRNCGSITSERCQLWGPLILIVCA